MAGAADAAPARGVCSSVLRHSSGQVVLAGLRAVVLDAAAICARRGSPEPEVAVVMSLCADHKANLSGAPKRCVTAARLSSSDVNLVVGRWRQYASGGHVVWHGRTMSAEVDIGWTAARVDATYGHTRGVLGNQFRIDVTR